LFALILSVAMSSEDVKELLKRRVRAAQGQLPCDVILKGVRYLDVFSCEWRHGEIAIVDGTIVGLDSGLKAKREIDYRDCWVVPGFIDAHVHVESSLMIPRHFETAVLSRGTTSAVCDPHELANVQGVKGIQYFLDSAQRLSMDLWVMLSSCVPATHLETNGGGSIEHEALGLLKSNPRALGLAEVMNVPGVLSGQDAMLSKIEGFCNGVIDGHAPLVRGLQLSAYASVGITSCHESSSKDEAAEKLMKGIAVWIREGSVAKDLAELSPLLNMATSTSIGFCTDDRNPLDIMLEGHVDHLVRETIQKNQILPEIAYRAASWTVARHYGLNRGLRRVGAIAPGYMADLVILSDDRSAEIRSVFKSGQITDEIESKATHEPAPENSVFAKTPEVSDLEGPSGRVRVIQVIPGKIITGSEVRNSDEETVMRLTVLERHGKGNPPANGYVSGFGKLKGAIASSVGHDSHNLIAVGRSAADIRVALQAVIRMKGGFCVVQDKEAIAELALPFGGLMSLMDSLQTRDALVKLKSASRMIGCELHEPFLQLAFLSLPVIPSLKLTDLGLVDVEAFKIIPVAV
jgi:adenine deaminase